MNFTNDNPEPKEIAQEKINLKSSNKITNLFKEKENRDNSNHNNSNNIIKQGTNSYNKDKSKYPQNNRDNNENSNSQIHMENDEQNSIIGVIKNEENNLKKEVLFDQREHINNFKEIKEPPEYIIY